jgi:chorismate mutase
MDPEDEILELRGRIDRIDKEMILLLRKRFEAVKRIGRVKRVMGVAVEDTDREVEVLRNCLGAAEGSVDENFIKRFTELVLEHSKKVQRGLK